MLQNKKSLIPNRVCKNSNGQRSARSTRTQGLLYLNQQTPPVGYCSVFLPFQEDQGSRNLTVIWRLVLQDNWWAFPVFTAPNDDLDKYLALPAIPNQDPDVLKWWKGGARSRHTPEDTLTCRPEGMPRIARIARQYIGRGPPRWLALSECSARRASYTTTSKGIAG